MSVRENQRVSEGPPLSAFGMEVEAPMEAMPQAQYVRRRAEQTVGELCETSELEKKSFVLRAVRNEVIGNRTKKFAYVSEGAVEAVAAILRDSIRSGISDATTRELIVQAAAALGSFTCGLDVGAEAVIKTLRDRRGKMLQNSSGPATRPCWQPSGLSAKRQRLSHSKRSCSIERLAELRG